MRKTLLIVAAVVIVLGAILTGLATYYTEYLWFEHLGFGSVYIKRLFTQVGMGVGFGLVALAVLGVHILFIRRHSQPRAEWTISTAAGEEIDVRDVVRKVSTPVVVAAAMLTAAVLGYWASRHWEEFLRFFNRTMFGQVEPILDKDIGVYLFILPTMQFVQTWLIYLTGICVVFSAVVYFLRGAISVAGRFDLQMSKAVRGHLLFGLACVLAVIAWGWRIEMYETLFSKRGVAYGATYTDVYVNLIAYRIMIGVCLAVAAYFLFSMFVPPAGTKATRYPAYALAGMVGLYLIGTFAWPTIVQQFVVNPNELDKERPYLVHAIAGTRAAYELDKVQTRPFPATDALTLQDLRDNLPTIDNIKIFDHRPLKSTYKQVQVIRLYYDFPSINVDRYHADGRYWQVMLSARELVLDQLPEQSQTWVNRHLQYTHGYGVCLSPVNQVVGEGLPDLWVKDIPPESRHPHMQISRPEIYFGQSTNDYVLVRTKTQEFDYPKGEENVYTTYEGKGGVGIGSFFRRLLFAIRMGDINLFFTRYLTEESRILFYRQVQERVAEAAPFLMLDQEPYMTIVDGRLFWIQDAYTVSYRYPYSQPTPLGRGRRINYVRNSVKAVVDAYHGTVTFYVWDEQDPMVQTYSKMFPALFRPGKEMPAALRKHVRYPKDLFTIQSVQYESFHMTDPRVFYNQEDKWSVSRELAEKTFGRRRDATTLTPGVTARRVTETSRMDPYYMIMRLPGVEKEEFLLMVPFTPTNRDNMIGWMAARCDEPNYGKLVVYQFPKQKLVFGPMQIEARIDQDEHVSQWITLRNQLGSTVIRGDLMVIPINDSVLYVEPIYLESTQTKLPELKQVIVAFGKRLTMKGTLEEALHEVFGVKGTPQRRLLTDITGEGAIGQPGHQQAPSAVAADAAVTAVVEDAASIARQALDHYDAAQSKLGKGDWAGYGNEQEALKKVLSRLAEKLGKQLQPAPSTTPPAPAPTPAPAPAPAH